MGNGRQGHIAPRQHRGSSGCALHNRCCIGSRPQKRAGSAWVLRISFPIFTISAPHTAQMPPPPAAGGQTDLAPSGPVAQRTCRTAFSFPESTARSAIGFSLHLFIFRTGVGHPLRVPCHVAIHCSHVFIILQSVEKHRFSHTSLRICLRFEQADFLACAPSADGCLAPSSAIGIAAVSAAAPHLHWNAAFSRRLYSNRTPSPSQYSPLMQSCLLPQNRNSTL